MPQLGVSGAPRCVVAVSLASRFVFLTITNVEDQFALVPHESFIHEQVDGIHYDADLGRLFIACRGKSTLQEVILDVNGNYRRHTCSLTNVLDPGAIKLRDGDTVFKASDFVDWIKGEFFAKSYSFKEHIFCTDRKKEHLYQLETKLRSQNGVSEEIIEQNLFVYDIAKSNFEYMGVLNLRDILTDSSRVADRTVQKSASETKQKRIVGFYANQTSEWDLSLVYDNGYQKRVSVMFTVGDSGKAVSCRLHHYLGRSIDPFPCNSLSESASSAQQQTGVNGGLGDLNPITSACSGYHSISSIVHKQLRGNQTFLMIENRMSLVPSASKYQPNTRKINTVERVQTHSVSCVLQSVDYIDRLDSQIVFDANVEHIPGQSLFHQLRVSSSPSVLESPVVRDLYQGSLDLHDSLVVAIGDRLHVYRRLRISDVVYSILYHLDLAETVKILPTIAPTQAESDKLLHQKTASLHTLQKVLRWDLILYGLKVRHQNLCTALLSIITNVSQRAFVLSKGLKAVYAPILAHHEVQTSYQAYCSMDTHSRIRRVAARVLQEFCQVKTESLLLSLSLAEPYTLKPYILENSEDNQVLRAGERIGEPGNLSTNLGGGLLTYPGAGQDQSSPGLPSSPFSYSVLVGLSACVASIWRKPFFRHTMAGPRPLYVLEDLSQVQGYLRNFLAGLSYFLQVTKQTTGLISDKARGNNAAEEPTRVLSVVNLMDVRDPLYAFGKGLATGVHDNRGYPAYSTGNFAFSGNQQRSSEIRSSEVGRWCQIATNTLSLLSNLLANPVVLKRLDPSHQHALVSLFIGDVVEPNDLSLQLSPFILKLLEDLLEDQLLTGFTEFRNNPFDWTSSLLEEGEFALLVDIVALKRLLARRNDQNGKLDLDEKHHLEEILNRLKGVSNLLKEHHLKEISVLLLNLDRLDVLGSILVGRLEYLNSEKARTQEKLDSEMKRLKLKRQKQAESKPAAPSGSLGISVATPEESGLSLTKAQPNTEDQGRTSSAEDNSKDCTNLDASGSDNELRSLQSQCSQLETECKGIFNQIFGYLYEIAGLEKVELQTVELPAILKGFKFISYLWDLLYCNKKTVVRSTDPQSRSRVTIVGKRQAEASKLLIQEFVARNKQDCTSVLVGLLKQILTSTCTDLRKSVMTWLVNIGQFSLIAEIDGDNSDKSITSLICELLATEDLLEPQTANDNLRFLVENLSARQEWKACLRVIQMLLDGTQQLRSSKADQPPANGASPGTPQSLVSKIHEVYNSFLGAKNCVNYLDLSQVELEEFVSRISIPGAVDNLERNLLINKANEILEKHGSTFGAERAKTTKLFLEKERSVRLQTEIIEELELLEFQMQKTLSIFSKLTTPEGEPTKLCKILYQQPEVYLNSSAKDSENAIRIFAQRLQLFRQTLNSKIWNLDVLINRVVHPLSLFKTLITAMFDENSVKAGQFAEKLELHLESMLSNCASLQNLHSLLNFANPLGQVQQQNVHFYERTSEPEVMEVLVDLQRSATIWPSNFHRQFNSVVRAATKTNRLQGTDLSKLCYSILTKTEKVSLLNPYNQLLHMDIRSYLSFHPSGYVEPKTDSNNPMLTLYQEHDVWITATALGAFSKGLQVLPAAFNSCLTFSKELHLSTDVYSAELKDLQLWSCKIFNTIMGSDLPADREWLQTNHRGVNRAINDMCNTANTSLVLSQDMKKYAKFVMIQARSDWDEYRAKHLPPVAPQDQL